jgi:N-acetylmuramoyl-L-alanine amidase
LAIDPLDKNLLKIKNGVRKDDRFIFRYVFRDAEIRKRAEIINAFHPDLTIIIHFNVDEKNKDWLHPTDKNYCMTFVGGAYEAGEMSDAERRFDFLRLLMTTDLDESTIASGFVAAAFQKYLNVPLATSVDATYLMEHCVPTDKAGVFCRNLSLTRLVQGPLVYGETLYQDNYLECLKLSSYYDVKIEGVVEHEIIYPRVNQVVQAYENGVLNYFRGK